MKRMHTYKFSVLLVVAITVCFVQCNDRRLYQHPNEAFETIAKSRAAASLSLKEAVKFYNFWQRGGLNSAFSKAAPKFGLPDDELSEQCANQLLKTLNATTDAEQPWALRMFDAWGKPEAGFTTGIINWLGDYPECVGIDSSGIRGRYCTGTYPMESVFNGANVTVNFQLGLCVPSACNADDAAALFNYILKLLNPDPGATAYCQPLNEEREWTNLAITTYVVYGIMLTLCLCAGLYDYYIHDTPTYYMVHQLPIPTSILPSSHLSVSADRIVSDDEGRLIQDEVTEDSERDEPTVSIRYEPSTHNANYLELNTAQTNGYIVGESNSKTKQEAVSLKLRRWLLLFSCYTSGYKILSAHHSPGSIECIHGIRFLSLSWVIMGHSLLFSITSIASMQVVFSWLAEFPFQAIGNATVSVDSFFMISGLLTTYLLLKDFHSRQIGTGDFFKSVPVLYLHRYLRLTPALAFFILFWTYGLYHTSNGPQWPVGPAPDVNCLNNSWATLLYMNNIYQPGNACAVWTWYLSNDFQFFLVTPFIAGLIYWKEKAGVAVAALLVLISCLSCVIVSLEYDLSLSLTSDVAGGAQGFVTSSYFTDYYMAPWTRYQSFGVGVLIGYAIWKSNGKLNINWITNLLLWLLSAAFCILPLYGLYKDDSQYQFSRAESVLYNSFSRLSWSLGLGYLVLACHCGRGGWVNDLLSWRGFLPLSRLTYCAYLLHPAVMTIYTFSLQSLIRYTKLVYVQSFLCFLFASYGLAFLFSMLFEAPFLNIDKYFITGSLKGKKKNV